MVVFLAMVFGLLLGSFANVVIYRTPRGETVLKPARSYCPSCGASLSALDLIPVLSWLALRAKCRRCKAKISQRYPLVELLTGGLFVLVSVFVEPFWRLPFGGLFVFFLVAVSFIDFDTQIIPDGLIVFGAVCGAGYVVTSYFISRDASVFLEALLGVVAGAAPLFLIDIIVQLVLKKDGFGYGDMKLMAVCGLFISWKHLLLAFLIAAVTGGIAASALLFAKKAEAGAYIAFGPFLAVGSFVAFLWAEPIISWYFGFF